MTLGGSKLSLRVMIATRVNTTESSGQVGRRAAQLHEKVSLDYQEAPLPS